MVLRLLLAGGLALGLVSALPAAANPTQASGARPVQLKKSMRQQALRLLPSARRLHQVEVPAEQLDPGEGHLRHIWRAEDERGQLAGWVRPMWGPVSPAGACPCNPLDVTLVFEPGLRLLEILSPAPLQKWNHQALSPSEHRRMVSLADAPPQALMAVAHSEQLLELETGATRATFAPHVVDQAALSTHRLAAWTAATRRILGGGPVDAQRQQLFTILRQEARLGGRQVDLRLAALLPQLVDGQLQLQAYHHLSQRYLASLRRHEPAAAAIEDALVHPQLRLQGAEDEVWRSCYLAVEDNLQPALGRRCLAEVPLGPGPFGHLVRGTIAYFEGAHAQAVEALQLAAGSLPPDNLPLLHLRLAEAAMRLGDVERACGVAELLYPHAPLVPGLGDLLGKCNWRHQTAATFVAELKAQAKAAFLRTDRRRPAPQPTPAPLPLTSLGGEAVSLPVASAGELTVVMFFATWCPHCRMELPRVNDFARSLARHPQLAGHVRVVGVRTAVGQETEPFEQVLAAVRPAFLWRSDLGEAPALTAFAQAHQLPLALPITAVVDPTGAARFVLTPGDWKDTAQELTWAAEALWASTSAAAAKK